MADWQAMTLGDFVTFQRGHDLPDRERRQGAIPVMGSAGITGYHDMAVTDGQGIVVGRSGASYGVVSWCSEPFWPLNTALYVKDFHGNDRRFAFYFLRSFDFSGYNVGSAQPSLNRNHIHPIRIEVPPLEEQKAIARVLGVLDDKIELNRRMNQTLEALARALFKSWFVDFDPVVAKAAGKKPVGMSAPTAALFPDRFQDSTLGPIPKGWRVGTFGDVARSVRCGATPADVSPGTVYIALEHMPRRCIALSEWEASDGIMSQKSRFERGDVLFGKLRPYFHKVGIAPANGVCSTDILVIRPAQACWSGLTLMCASSDEMVQHADNTSGGTKMPRTSWDDLARFQTVVPPESIGASFSTQVGRISAKIIGSIYESKSLAALRDALLPQLMSGELRVRQAETLLEHAT